MRNPNSFIGSPTLRVEDFRFLRGSGQFIDDVELPGQWHAAILRSPVAHGRILALDPSGALDMPGVKAVVTGADIGAPMPTIPFRRPNPTIGPYAQPVIASDVVRYVGEPVAMVLASSAERAEDALSAITLEIDPFPAIVDTGASRRSEILLFPATTTTNSASVFNSRKGDAEAAFGAAAYTKRDRFRVQRMTAMPMEPRGLVAVWDEAAGKLSVSGAAKLPFFNRNAMAGMMGLPPERVDYIEVDVGGGFGARGEFYPEDYLVAFAARRFGHPIKWTEDRREHFVAMAHSREADCDVEIGLDRDGIVIGIRGDIWCDIGAYVRPNGMTPVRNAAQFLTGPYRIGNVAVDAHAMISNKTPSGTYRGPGRFEGCFFLERLLHMAALDLGIDQVELRRRNLVRLEEMPYRLAKLEPDDGFGSNSLDSGDNAETLDAVIRESGWAEKQKLQGKLIDGRYHGLGLACFIEGGGSGPRENARAELEKDGSVTFYVGSSSVGQGIETIFTQIAADALEIPLDRIRILHGSTNYLKEGFGSYGSRATVMGGNAVVAASNNLLAKFRSAAAQRLGVEETALTIAEGAARTADGRQVTLADLAGLELRADGTHSGSKATYTYGAAVAHVAVDPATGHVQLVDYTVVDDVGRIINPMTLHGQIVGAAVQGLGSTFSEEIVYDSNGQPVIATLADYLVPVSTDYPNLTAISFENHPSPNNPLGAKGAGEGGIIPVGASIANAVSAALASLGVEVRALPLSPPRVWELIENAEYPARKV